MTVRSSIPHTDVAQCATVSREASTALLGGEKVAKRRFQAPEPERSGRWWYVRYWDDVFEGGRLVRKRKRHQLAPATTGERQAKKMAAEFLRPLNQGLAPLGSAMLFSEYVETTYNSTLLPLMAKSTRGRYEGVIRNYLTPAFGSKCLRDLTPLVLQQYFSNLPDSKLSYESRDKIRDVLSSILSSAITYGALVKNPADGIRLAPSKRGNRIKPFLEPAKFQALLALIPEPYSTMVYVAVYTGLRASELIGLKWKSVGADSITVAERYCRGDWGAPKSKASNANLAVNPDVIKRIQPSENSHHRNQGGECRASVSRREGIRAGGPSLRICHDG